MSQKFETIPTLDKSPVETSHNRAEKRRRALRQLLESIPVQINAIKEKREQDSIELRHFMMQRENDEQSKRLKVPRLNGSATSINEVFKVPRHIAHLSRSVFATTGFGKERK